MKRFRRAAAVAAGLTVAALALTGCASGGSDGGKVTLNYWTLTLSKPNGDALNKIIDEFEKDHPDITVKVTQKGTDALKDALRQAGGTPAMPDIYFMFPGVGLGGEYVKQGLSLDLTKYYKKYDWTSRFTPSSLTAITQYGGYNGVPQSTNIESMVYNKALFAKAGITTTPTTYDELVADAAKLKAAGVSPITYGGTDNWDLMRLLDNILETECGSSTFDRLTGLKANWGKEPCVTKSFTELKKWADDYIGSEWVSQSTVQAEQQFFQGKVAMAQEGDWFGNMLVGAKFSPASDLGVFPFPTGTGRVYSLQAANYIAANTKHADQAASFLDFFFSKGTQTKYNVFSSIPVIKGVPVKDSGVGLTDAWADMAKNAKGSFQNNDQTFPLDVTTEYWRIQNGVATGQIPPSDAGAQLQKFIGNRSK